MTGRDNEVMRKRFLGSTLLPSDAADGHEWLKLQDLAEVEVERLVTTVTNDVEQIESTTINGQAIVRIFFQPGANSSAAVYE